MSPQDPTVDPVRDLRWVLLAVVVAVVAVLLVQAGCNTGPERRIAGGRVQLDLSEYSITPRNLVMPAGRLVIDGRNTGRLVHSLRLVSDDDKRGNRRTRYARSDGTPLRPGDTRRDFLSVCLAPGEYRIIGGQAGEEDLGMVADLRVTGPEPDCTPEDGRRNVDPTDPSEAAPSSDEG
jgi:hypothetical protein